MPISDHLAASADAVTPYQWALNGFVAAHVSEPGLAGIVQAYRAVQAMPYYSGPDRTPEAALRDGRGACTAKHLVLRDVLRQIGASAAVEIIEGDFAQAVPQHPSMPEPLLAMIRAGGVIDFHCRVRLGTGQALDATWPLGLARWGIAVDAAWAGIGDTAQAMAQVTLRSSDEDVLGTKAKLLAGLSKADSQRRLEFLALLSGWMAGLLPASGTIA